MDNAFSKLNNVFNKSNGFSGSNIFSESNVFLESIVIGFITLIIGKIIFSVFYKQSNKEDNKKEDNKKEDNKKQNNNMKLNFILFFTGVILHFIIEYIGFNKWYCDKQCYKKLASLSKNI